MDTHMQNVYPLWAGILFAGAIMAIAWVLFCYAVVNMCSSPICSDGSEEENIYPRNIFREEIDRSERAHLGNLNRDAFLKLSNPGGQQNDCIQTEV